MVSKKNDEPKTTKKGLTRTKEIGVNGLPTPSKPFTPSLEQGPPKLKIFKPKDEKKSPCKPAFPMPDSGLQVRDISYELWREYQYGGNVIHIDQPQFLVIHKNDLYHRIVAPNGVTHIFPSPGFHGCVLRIKNSSSVPPVMF